MQANCHANDIIRITFSVENISTNKKYKDQKKKQIVNAICALSNSDGGRVEFSGEETKGNLVSTTLLDSLTRNLEQSLMSRFGARISESVINFEDRYEKMIAIRVCKARLLVTIQYNLYLSTRTQVEPTGNVPIALKILNRRFVEQPVQIGSHHKIFFKSQNCLCLSESKVAQFKLLKSDSSKRVTLADRMISKSNKFTSYVSAFANHRGGHIYYGIDDDGKVQGEKTKERSDIEKKVGKAIQKMIWPEKISQPKRGKHWEIFFEPVLDKNSNLIPSTFVIVIFIAPCFGGVFTEEPESYEMVEGKVKRMSFTTWKEKLQPVGLSKRKQEIPSTIKRVSLSAAAKKRCTEVNEILTEAVNNGEWESFARWANYFKKKYSNNLEVKLIVSLKKVRANYRRGNIPDASLFLTKFEDCFPRAEEPLIFEVLFLSLKAAVARVSGKTAEYRDFLTGALTIAEGIEPGLYTAAIYLVAASISDNSQNDARSSPDILCTKALKHLEYVKDAPVAGAEKYHNAHITLAAYHLGYNLSGKIIKNNIDKESIQRAQASIMAVNKSICDGNPLTEYREIWLTLSQSMLYIRHSQLEFKKQTKFLNSAFNYAKKAENLAKNSGLVEMVSWAQTTIASCVEALLLAKLTKMGNIKLFKAQQKV